MSLIFLLFLIPTISNSYGEPSQKSIFIFVQNFLRDSNGNLVVYEESEKFTDVNLDALNAYLDFEANRGNDPILNLGDKKLQIIKRSLVNKYEINTLIDSVLLIDSQNPTTDLLVRFAHDGYHAAPGDELTSIWTFVREIP